MDMMEKGWVAVGWVLLWTVSALVVGCLVP